MIGSWYGKYCDAVAADAGAWAFFKWLAVGVGLQFVAVFLGLPIVMLSLAAPEPMRKAVSAWLFILCFFAARWLICVIPSARAADHKGRTPGWLWGALALCFGQLALAIIAGLPPAGDKKA